MADYSRRRLLGSALGIGGSAAAASLLPPHLQRAMAEPVARPGSLDDVEHVVILMQENRSFDHYFGTLRGVRGFDDPDASSLPGGRSVFHQPDAASPDGYLLPFHLDTHTTSSQAIPSTSHAWEVQHQAWNGGAMDNWLPAHREADGDDRGPYTMSYYNRGDIPFHFALAESFTVCDNYFGSVLGPTWPNRFYHWTGTIDPRGEGGGPVITNVIDQPFRWTTYPERLTAAGVSWHVYREENDYGCNPLEFFQAYQDSSPGDALYEHGLTISPAGKFAEDAENGRLPTVSWIIPTAAQCEHPDYLPASGADFIARQLNAIAKNKEVWRKTVFILNYDENDGLFDHAIPPTPPSGTPDEFVGDQPIGAGIRVPCVIVSPWSQGGHVARERFDHTSVLRFLEELTGVRETNISAWRRRTFGDLTSALGFSPNRPFPPLPGTKNALWNAEREVATLPPAEFPHGHQHPPNQERQAQRQEPQAPRGHGVLGGRRPYALSRITENATTHKSDFPHGTTGTNFPGIHDSVPDTGPTSGEHVYSVGVCSNTVDVLDPHSNELLASIPAGINPAGITQVPGTSLLYITNSGASDMSLLDTSQGTILSTSVTVGLHPQGVAAAPDGRQVYVAGTGPDTGPGGSRVISVVDTDSHTVSATWRTGLAPQRIAVHPDGRRLYVTCYDGLFVIDTANGRQLAELAGQAKSRGVAVHPDGSRVYVANTWHGTLDVIDTGSNRVTNRLRVGRTPWQVALSADGSRAYVSGAGDDTITAVDTAGPGVLDTVRVGHVPTGVATAGHTVWVSTNASSTVDALDTGTLKVTASTPLGLSTAPGSLLLA